jgi:magnesium-transporting ATPase (P-type)
MYNKIYKSTSKALDGVSGFDAFLVILLVIAMIIGLCYLGFWLFIWAVATLFHFTIEMTFINWLAFMVLVLTFKGGGSSSND